MYKKRTYLNKSCNESAAATLIVDRVDALIKKVEELLAKVDELIEEMDQGE